MKPSKLLGFLMDFLVIDILKCGKTNQYDNVHVLPPELFVPSDVHCGARDEAATSAVTV